MTMRAEFFHEEHPDEVVAVVSWGEHGVLIEANEERVRERLEWMFRTSPVAVDAGTPAERTCEPGDIDWFRAVLTERAAEAGLPNRLVVSSPGGWDPAGSYRPMRAWVARREGGPAPDPSHEPGYA
ncbi:MAG: hypothetical protein ACRDH6_02865 [Actinomycetota bacterium]